MRTPGFTRAMLIAVFLLPAAAFGQIKDLTGIPTKIKITSDSVAPVKGENLKVYVTLLDPENRAVAANKDFEVEVEGRSQSGAVEKSKILIKSGQTGQTTQLPVKDSGIVELVASNLELATGGTIVNVRDSARHERFIKATPSPAAEATPSGTASKAELTSGTTEHFSQLSAKVLETHDQGEKGASTSAKRRPESALNRSLASSGPKKFDTATSTTTSSAPAEHAPQNLSLPAPSSSAATSENGNWNPNLTFLYYPKRPLKADLKDAATICASLPANDPARVDLLIYLMSDIGPLTPEPIKIPQGGIMGSATLVTDRPAAVQVWYQYSTPWAKAPAPPLTINFCPPVWALRVVPRSPKIGLFDSVKVGVELVDAHGTNVPADEKREVHLSLGSGSGELGDAPPAFDPGSSQIEAKFTPTWPGVVKVIATSPYLQEASGSFTVAPPFSLLLFCALGGLLGGLLAYLTERPAASWLRIVIGLITGFVLYWGILFGPIPLPNVSHAYLLNPFTVTIVAICGGWIGTKVFTLLFSKFGWKW